LAGLALHCIDISSNVVLFSAALFAMAVSVKRICTVGDGKKVQQCLLGQAVVMPIADMQASLVWRVGGHTLL
jgi:hypothetical protein